jgi:hypothetical protein
MTTLAQTMNVLRALILTGSERTLPTPNYHAFEWPDLPLEAVFGQLWSVIPNESST